VKEALQHSQYLILVDDGSTDGTNAILQEIAWTHPTKIHLITFPTNRGKGKALLAGIRYALGHVPFDALVCLDSDGQHPPSKISSLAAEVEQGADFVIGVRDFNQMPFRSRFANTLISFLLKRIYPNAPIDNQSGFRAFSRKFSDKILHEIKGNRYEMEFRCILLALRDRFKIQIVPIPTIYLHQNASSHFSKFKDSYLILKVFLNFLMTGSL
jgi:glycosyltransferase involved in cell wall biosynthesis